ncbi:unnamed protein product [Rhizoctonia solani]|uniref:BTB domain-containing protein n=1 Tax=Rhizoctonia solani TaxID=456999 RepID=A0A8H3H180_9AGAM|nr:unnamed protein product [Rhizoctonia solani]
MDTIMSASRSDKFYFPRGGLVLQVENTLFRLHQDILARHSGFFEDMLSTPTSDDTEGTEKNPLVLPSDLCSARSFTILCKLLYPPKMGAHLSISVKQLKDWEHVLQATVALQMTDTRTLILKRLDEDTPNIKYDAVRLLRLYLDYEEAPPSLRYTCLCILACRRRQITPDEVRILGGEGTCLVNYIREAVRENLSLHLIRLLHQNKEAIPARHAECIPIAYSRMVRSSIDKGLPQTKIDDTHDIFQDALGCMSCSLCSSPWKLTVESLKILSNGLVDRNTSGAPPTADTSQA